MRTTSPDKHQQAVIPVEIVDMGKMSIAGFHESFMMFTRGRVKIEMCVAMNGAAIYFFMKKNKKAGTRVLTVRTMSIVESLFENILDREDKTIGLWNELKEKKRGKKPRKN